MKAKLSKLAQAVVTWVTATTLRVYVAIFALSVLPLTLFLFAAHNLLVRQVNEKLVTQSVKTGNLIGNLIDTHIEQNKTLLESFATRPDLVRSIEANDFERIQGHLAQGHALRPDFLFLSVYDPSGTMKGIYPLDLATLNKNYSFRDWYKGQSEQSRTYVSEVYETAVGDHARVVAIVTPIKNHAGQTIGLLMAPQTVDTILQDLHTLTNPQGSSVISLVDQHGHVFGNDRARVRELSQQARVDPALLQQVSKGEAGTGLRNLADKQMLVTYCPIPRLKWGVLIETPPEAINTALWEYEKSLLILGLIIAAIAVGAGGFVVSLYQRLRKSERRTRVIIEEATDAFVSIDATGKITEWNPKASAMFGWTRDEALGHDAEEAIIAPARVFVPTKEGRLLVGLFRLATSKPTNKLIELMGIHRDGSHFPLELSVSVVHDRVHPTLNIFLRDITDRKAAEQAVSELNSRLEDANANLELRNREVERATKLKSQFLASMSHELRTPLNAIVGFSDLLSEQIAGPLNEKQVRFVGHIKTGSRHLLQLINDILDLSKIEAGHLHLEREDVSVADLMPEVLSTIRPLAMQKKIHLVEDLEAHLAVHADRVRFKQIIYNLLSNAIKFTPEGGSLFVTACSSGGVAELSVRDTGVGIREEDLTAVFDEFRQVGDTTKGIKEGTGLGLAITRKIVEQHEGRIWVESEFGKGSTFTFTVPLAKKPLVETAPVPISALPHGDRRKVLIVDDEVSAQELLASHLSTAGYQVFTASNGGEAIEKAKDLMPDVITLDILMPDGNGFAALFELRRRPETSAIPVIIVSIVDQKDLGLTLGAADYLLKPVDKNQLLRTIHTHVSRKKDSTTNILIIDDDEQVRELLYQTLSAEGYGACVATNGVEALQALKAVHIDAIMLDLVMPEMDGFEVLQQIKTDERLRDIPVFVMTAKDLSAAEISALKKEAAALVHKNGDWKKSLLNQLNRAVESSATARSAGAA